MSWEWEEFTHKSDYRAEMIRVSLNARGQFLLNRKAVSEMGDPVSVVLLFSRSSRLIGVKGSPPEVEHSYELKQQGSSLNYLVRARSFCSYYSINVGDPITFNDVFVDNGVIVLNLDNVTEVVRRARQTEMPFRASEHIRSVPQPPKFSSLLRMRPVEDE